MNDTIKFLHHTKGPKHYQKEEIESNGLQQWIPFKKRGKIDQDGDE
jgi:hypothetical protein